MDSICIVVAELLDYLADLLILLVDTCFSDESFKSGKVSLSAFNYSSSF